MGEKFDKVMAYTGMGVFIILLIVGAGIFIIYERINRGCWNFGFLYEAEIIEEFDMKNYSCEKLREILLLEVFPKEARRITTQQHCDGEIVKWGAGDYIETDFFYEYDYKDKYKEECLI